MFVPDWLAVVLFVAFYGGFAAFLLWRFYRDYPGVK